MMFLSRFRVRGYKCLLDVEVPLTPIHVLIGPNNCGKTSLLEALSAFQGRLKTPGSQWFPDTANARDLISYGSNVPTIDLAGEWSHVTLPSAAPSPPVAGYGYSIVVPTTGFGFGVMDQWVRPPASHDAKLGLAHAATAYPHGSSKPTIEERTAQETFSATIQKMLRPAPVYRFVPWRLAEPVEPNEERSGRLASDGYGLADLLDLLVLERAESFLELRSEFCRLVPEFQNIHLQAESPIAVAKRSSRPRKSAVTKVATAHTLVFETRWGRRVPARDASAGVLLLLALLTLARLPDPPAMLLIENIEHGIHPKRLGDILRPLKLSANRGDGRPFPQVIISTHSPHVVDFFDPDEVTLLSRAADKPHGPTIARPLRQSAKVRTELAKGDACLGEVWYNLGENELFGEG